MEHWIKTNPYYYAYAYVHDKDITTYYESMGDEHGVLRLYYKNQIRIVSYACHFSYIEKILEVEALEFAQQFTSIVDKYEIEQYGNRCKTCNDYFDGHQWLGHYMKDHAQVAIKSASKT